MKITRIIMGMPVTVEIVDKNVPQTIFEEIFSYFQAIDQKFSTYKPTSEISLLNSGKIKKAQLSKDLKIIFKLAKKTKKETKGFFDMQRNGQNDPSGLVKGWAIFHATKLLHKKGFKNFCLEVGGDIQTSGNNENGQPWTVGIRNPFNTKQIIKVIRLNNQGVATSGIYERGQHIYHPRTGVNVSRDVVSLTVIGKNIYDADRFATAAFAMGKAGINFLENLPGFEGYLVDQKGMATYTSGFEKFIINI